MRTTSRVSFLVLFAINFVTAGCGNSARDRTSGESMSAVQSTSNVTPSGAAREIEVLGLDYAFSMPDSVDAGRTAFRFTNRGKVDHEYNIVLLKPEVTLRQYIDAANKAAPTAPLIDGPVGVLFAKPGQTSVGVLSAEMRAGRTYAIQCINRDTEKAPTHRELGMFKSISVRSNAAPVIPPVAIDTIVGTDYAYTKYPKMLTPGWHHFAFVNAGKQRHEINLILLKPGVTVLKVLEVAGKGGDIDALMDEALGVLHARAGTSPLGTLDFEVLAGREYLIVCTFQDTPTSPPHFALGMATSMVALK
ncbi:MAG: hypothetical protein ABJB74_07970 [Gemmatimonas sp.]